MGERSIPRAEDRPSRSGWWAVVALTVAILALAAAAASPDRSWDRGEVAAVLLAESLRLDGDVRFAATDIARLTAWRDIGSRGAPEIPGPRLRGAGEVRELDAPRWYGWFLAPWVALGGARLASAAQVALVGLAWIVAAAVLRRRLGAGAGWLVVLGAFGSALFVAAAHLWAEGLLVGLVAAGFALAAAGGPPVRDELPELYAPEGDERASRHLARWLVAGALLGVVSGAALPYLPLAAGALGFVGRTRRRTGLAAFGIAAAITAGGVLLIGDGLAGWVGTGNGIDGTIRVGERVVEVASTPLSGLASSARFTPSLWGWNLAYLAVGRHVGLLLYAVPLLVVLAVADLRQGRGWVLGGAALGILLLLWVRPWSWAGGPFLIGPRGVLPFVPALWFLAARPPARIPLLLGWIAAGAVLGPFWWRPLRPTVDGEAGATFPPPWIARWAPIETTLDDLPLGAAVRAGEAELRLLGGGAWAGPGPGRFQVLGNEPVEVLVSAPRPLAGLALALPEEAGTEVDLAGADAGDLTFRPDGTAVVDVRFARVRAQHPTARSPGGAWLYRFRLRLPEAPYRPVGVAVDLLDGGVDSSG